MPENRSDPPERPASTPPARSADLVLELLCDGVPRDVIADRLGLSVHTVNHHVLRAMNRAGAESAIQLVAGVWAARVADLERRLAAREGLRHDRRSSDRRRSDGVG